MKSEKIAVITYDHPHRKTQDVIFGLKANGYKQVKLYALPFVKRDNPFKPIYKHRPSDSYAIYPAQLADNFNYDFQKVEVASLNEVFIKDQPDFILIAGAGLLPAELVQNHQLINSHPAYLPEVRGLDALKWAIVHQKPIGVTSHFVNEAADAGLMIDRQVVSVFQEDTFHSLAYRQYQLEIKMLVDAIEKVQNNDEFPALEEKGEVNRRMPKATEKELLNYFKQYQESQLSHEV